MCSNSIVTIPVSLRPNGNSTSKPLTVGEQKRVQKYGSLERYEAVAESKRTEVKVKAEVKELGLDQISSQEDYTTKYSSASATTKQYLETPAEMATRIETTKQNTIDANTIKINEKIAQLTATRDRKKKTYRDKAKRAKKKGQDYKAEQYKDKRDEYDAYYDGIIDGLKGGLGTAANYSDIYSYAKDLGRYERDKEEARNEGKTTKYQKPNESRDEWNQRLTDQSRAQGIEYLQKNPDAWVIDAPNPYAPKKEMTMKFEDIKPDVISFDGGLTASPKIKPGQALYVPIEDIHEYKGGQGTAYTAPVGGRPVTIKPTVAHVGYSKPKFTPKEKEFAYVDIDKVGAVIPGQQPLKIDAPTTFVGPGTPTSDNLLMGSQTYPTGGTATYRPTTKDEKISFEEAQYKGSPAGVFNVAKEGVGWYQEKVVEPIAYTKMPGGGHLAGTYSKENFANLVKGYQQEIVEPIAGSTLFGKYEEKVVAPLSKNIISPTITGVTKGKDWYQEEVVRKVSKEGVPVGTKHSPARWAYKSLTGRDTTAPLGYDRERGMANNPIAAIAGAKQEIDILAQRDPDTEITLGIGRTQRTARAGDYSDMGIIEFSKEIYDEQAEAAFKVATKDFGGSERLGGAVGKTAKAVSKYSPYLLPGYYEGKIGAEMTEAQIGGGVLGGPSSAVEFIKERPVEVAVAAAIVAVPIITAGAKTLSKTNAAKFGKYLNPVKAEKDVVHRVMHTVKPKADPTVGTKIKITGKGEQVTRKTSPVVKGSTKAEYTTPTNKFTGRAEEIMQVTDKLGRTKNVVVKSKLNVVIKDTGEVIRTFRYADGTVKTITTKGSKITTKLTRNGKKLFEDSVVKKGFQDKMIKEKVPDVHLKIKGESIKTYRSVTRRVDVNGKVKYDVILRDGSTKTYSPGNAELKKILNEIEKTKSAKLRFDEVRKVSKIKGSLSGQEVTTKKKMVDLLQSSDTKVGGQATKGKAKVKQIEFYSQEFKVGKTQPDAIINMKGRGYKIKADSIGSKFSRTVKQKVSQDIISYRINPSFKKPEKVINMFAPAKVKTKTPVKIDYSIYNKAMAPHKPVAKAAKETTSAVGEKTKQILIHAKASRAETKAIQKSFENLGVTYVPSSTSTVPITTPLTTPASITVPTTATSSISAFGLAALSTSLLSPDVSSAQVQKDEQIFKLDTDTIIETDTDTTFDTASASDSKQDSDQVSDFIFDQPDTITDIFPDDPGQGTPTIGQPKSPPKGGGADYPIIVDIAFGGKRQEQSDLMQPYYGEVMVGGKYKRVTEKPHTKKGALDAIARIVDNTIAAQGRVVPTKNKKGSKLKGGDGYYNKHQKKFRGFRIVKGQQQQLKNTIIERKNKRLDTKGETSKLTVAQFTSRSRKRAAGLPVRKKKALSKRKTPFRL